MILRTLLLASLLAAAPAAAALQNAAASQSAPQAALDDDAKCIITLAATAGMIGRDPANLDEEGRSRLQTLQYSVHFYAGRIGARHPGQAAAAAMLATQRAMPASALAGTATSCLADYFTAMRAFGEEVQQAAPLANSTAPLDAAATAAGADSQAVCFAVLSHAISIADRRQSELPADLRAALPSLKGAIPFYAGRLSPRYAAGARGTAVAAAFRLWPRDRSETIMRECLAGIHDQLQILAGAARQMSQP